MMPRSRPDAGRPWSRVTAVTTVTVPGDATGPAWVSDRDGFRPRASDHDGAGGQAASGIILNLARDLPRRGSHALPVSRTRGTGAAAP